MLRNWCSSPRLGHVRWMWSSVHLQVGGNVRDLRLKKRSRYPKMDGLYYNWLVVLNMNFIFSHHFPIILGISSSQVTFTPSFFGVETQINRGFRTWSCRKTSWSSEPVTARFDWAAVVRDFGYPALLHGKIRLKMMELQIPSVLVEIRLRTQHFKNDSGRRTARRGWCLV